MLRAQQYPPHYQPAPRRDQRNRPGRRYARATGATASSETCNRATIAGCCGRDRPGVCQSPAVDVSLELLDRHDRYGRVVQEWAQQFLIDDDQTLDRPTRGTPPAEPEEGVVQIRP
jgi:hypothetical protein